MTISAIRRLTTQSSVDTEMPPKSGKTPPVAKGRLEAKWEVENGKLICRWIVL